MTATAITRSERAWTALGRRFGLISNRPIDGMADYIQPVIQAATPDFTDAERPMFVAGDSVTSVGGQRTAFELHAIVSLSLVGLIPGQGSWRLFSEVIGGTDFSGTGTTTNFSSVRPTGRPSRCFVRAGVSGAQPPAADRQNSMVFTSAFPLGILATMLVERGQRVILQSSLAGVGVSEAIFQWRELQQ